MQHAVQRFQTTNLLVTVTDTENSPAAASPSEADKCVPDSFAEWLERPSRTITVRPEPEPESEPGIFVRLLNAFGEPISACQPAKINQR